MAAGNEQSRAVVVTGVSTGIGLGITRVLISRGFRVFGSVRKQADAERLQRELGARFTPLLMDVTKPEEIRRAVETVSQALGGGTLFGLVNNAGIAVAGPLLHMPMDEARFQFEVNFFGPLAVSQAFGPLLGADRSRTGRPGRIVNISSTSGKMSLPFIGMYSASKFALEGLSDAMRRELLLYGIDVIVVGPGAVDTPIQEKGEAMDLSRYDATDYREPLARFRRLFLQMMKTSLTPDDLGQVVYRALTTPRPRTRYAAVRGKLANWTIPRLLPARTVDRSLGKQIGLARPS